MRWLQAIAREVASLFVEDGSFAVAILVWLALAVGVMPRFAPAARWGGPVLVAGLAVILVESVLRCSRRTK
jgi:hypothetical protein